MQGKQTSAKEQLLPEKKKRPHYIFDNLKKLDIWGYSVGHIFNDLCAAAWFNFLLFYLTKVLKFENGSYSMLFGQIADALGTPSAGILSDKYNTRFGKRTPWYFLSFILVLLTFLPMWCYPIMSKILPLDNDSFKTFFFIFFPALFNYFWAFGYIAHISLVPSLTCSRVRRDILNTRRNTFTFFSNMLLLVLALVIFQIIDDSEQQFQAVGIACSAIGSFFCIFFLSTVKEVPLTIACNSAVKNLKKVLKEREGENRQSLLLENGGGDDNKLIISENSDDNNSSNFNNKQAGNVPKKDIINQDSSIYKGATSEIMDSNKNKRQNEEQKQERKTKQNQQFDDNNGKEDEDKNQVIEDCVFSGADNYLAEGQEEEDQDQQPEKEEDQQEQIERPKNELRMSTTKHSTTDAVVDHVHSWKQWFREVQFYQYALVFMFSRLFCNVTTTMLNFYLYYVIQISGDKTDDDQVQLTFQLALIPLLLYLSSVGASSILNTLYQRIGRKMTFTLGVILMGVSQTLLIFLKADNSFLKNLIYPIAMVIGASQALQLNTAINLISEVIGLRGAGGAFVFGAYSFLDKLVTGIVLFSITESQSYKDNDPTFIRWIMVLIPAGASISAWVLILLGKAKDYDKNSKKVAKLSRMSLGDEFVN